MNRKYMLESFLIGQFLFLFFFGVIIGENSFAQERPHPDSTDIQRQVANLANERFGFVSGRGSGAGINRNGVLEYIVGGQINLGLTSNDPVERANQFFEHNQDLFQLQNSRSELVVRGWYRSENGSGHVDFDQVIGGAKVYLGGYSVYFNSDSSSARLTQIMSVGLGYLPEARNIDPVPTIDSLEAGRIAQADPANGDARTYTCCYELYISGTYDGIHKFDDGGVHLIWFLGLGGGVFNGAAQYVIDAHSGQILKVLNDAR